MPVLAEVTSTAARYVNPILDEIFSLLGIPTTLKSDNGPPFKGKEYRDFCEYLGIETKFITPYWPQANGMIEAFMRCLGKVVRASIVQKSDLKQDVNKFLRNHRATPHPATGESPSVMMWNRNRTSRLSGSVLLKETETLGNPERNDRGKLALPFRLA